jgi:tetratricopeptide (TPR) repeat protein
MLGERFRGFATLVLAVALLVLAIPRLGASLDKLPGNPGIDLLSQGELLSQDTLKRVSDSRQAARRWLDEPSTDYDLGLAAYGASRLASDPSGRTTLLREAMTDFRASLRKWPANPYAWTYLALVHTDLGDATNAVAMLEASYDFGPFMPENAIMRSYVAIATWASLDEFARLLARDDFVQAMTRQPTAFVQLVVIAKVQDEARRALAATPDLLVQFEKMLGAAEHGA